MSNSTAANSTAGPQWPAISDNLTAESWPLNHTERNVLAAYYCLILVLCWSGNLFVLYATLYHRAIKMDKLSVWIIQNLCVADALHGLVHVLPAAIFLVTGSSLTSLCRPLMVVKYTFVDCNSFLINALVFNKLIRCVFPFLRPCTRTSRVFVTVCAGLCGCLYTSVLLIKSLHSTSAMFNENYISCDSEETFDRPSYWDRLDLVMTCIILIIPVFTLIISNSLLLYVAWFKGARGPALTISVGGPHSPGLGNRGSLIKKRNFLIIGVTTLVYIVAQLPYLYFCFEIYGITKTFDTGGEPFIKYTRFSMVIIQTSCFINPYIYFSTNKGFRNFVLRFLKTRFEKEKPERRRTIASLYIEANLAGKATDNSGNSPVIRNMMTKIEEDRIRIPIYHGATSRI